MKRYLVLLSACIVGLLVITLEPEREDAGNIILGGIATVSWVFILVYMSRSDWAATAAGRAILRLVLCIGLLCTQGVATILTGYSYPLRDWIRPGLLLLIFLTLVDLCVVLVRIQREERHRASGPA
jgi:hypothetical protein